MLRSSKTETQVTSNGLHSAGSLDSLTGPQSLPTSPPGPESLPPLPGLSSACLPPTLPAMSMMPSSLMMPPAGLIFPPGGLMPMEMRQPPLGRMSPGPRDRTRSYDSRSPSPQYHRSPRYRDRDHSPTSRSERRPSPPSARHRGPSPARSERFYRDRRERERDRYYSSSRESRDRSLSPDREDSRSERSERNRAGPKTSTPGDPQNRGYNRA